MANETSTVQDEIVNADEEEKVSEYEMIQDRVDEFLYELRDCKYRDGSDGKLRKLSQAKVNYRVLDYLIAIYPTTVDEAIESVKKDAESVLTEKEKLASMVSNLTPEQVEEFMRYVESS